MNRRSWLTAVITLSTFIIALLIVTDWVPLLRGPQPDSSVWHWVYDLRPYARWWVVGLAGIIFFAIASIWLLASVNSHAGKTAVILTALAIATLFLQLSLIFADRGDAYAELIDRTLAVQTNGYFWTAAHTENLSDSLTQYPTLLITFESDHLRTHPPGLLIGNWLTIHWLAQQPSVSEQLAPAVWQQRCTDRWLLDSPPHIAAALGVWALLPLILAGTAVFPAYLIGKELTLNDQYARLGTILTALIPALLIFAPTPDQLSAVIGLWFLLLLFMGVRTKRLILSYLSGLLLSIMSFISLGNAALVILVSAFVIFVIPDQKWLRQAVAVALGSVTIWLIYWIGWGVPPWAIAQVALAEHDALVLTNRAYGTWTLFNLVDLLSFVGLPILIGFVGLLFGQQPPTAKVCQRLGVITAVLLLLLNFSGSTRGEVGRIWLFLFPILAICAGNLLARWLSVKQTIWVVLAQLLLVMAVGLAWQPIEATIVVAERPLFAHASPEHQSNIQFEQGIVLTGYSLSQTETEVDVTLFWQSEGGVQRPYTIFNHLLNQEHRLVAQQDGWSGNGRWPTSCWQNGETVVDSFTIELPPDLAAGEYVLFTGLYDARDNGRLQTNTDETAHQLATITIK